MNSQENNPHKDLSDWTKVCINPEHYPPMHLWIPPGTTYRHKCPGCGKETAIVMPVHSIC
jgi:hypothetical protein